MRDGIVPFLLLIGLLLSLGLVACSDVDSVNGLPDGDTGADGDASVDGDESSDGDLASDGDLSTDGDAPTDGDSLIDGDSLPDGDLQTDGDLAPDGDMIVDGDGLIDGDEESDGDLIPDGDEDTDDDLATDGDEEPELEHTGVDCSPIAEHADWELCASTETTCEAVFDDNAGCTALCAEANLICAGVFENIDDQCAADNERPALSCDPPSNHQSDYCICVDPSCEPDCDGKLCGDDGCGGLCASCDHYPNSYCDENTYTCSCKIGTCGSPQSRCGHQLDNGCGGLINCPLECLGDEECVDSYCKGPSCEQDYCPAFPGAEGEGMFAAGGRGGDVCHVTHTGNSGEGSLRSCADTQSGPRTVVFDVGGTITLESRVSFDHDGLTLAGQTAPGDGVQIRGYQVQISADDVIIQHLRFRAGDIKKKQCPSGDSGFTEDSLTLSGSRIIVDQVSASWGIDENLSASGEFHDLTVQYSIISEGLYQTGLYHGDCDSDYNPGGSKGHSMGSLFKPSDGDMNVSVHHNLYAHNNNRNPAVGTYEVSQDFMADIRNNVIYNCPAMGYTSGVSGSGKVNYIGNYAIWGWSTDDDTLFDPNEDNNVELYQNDNRRDRLRNGSFDGWDSGWDMFGGSYSQAQAAFEMNTVTTQSSTNALNVVLNRAGAFPWKRDAVDVRVVGDVYDNSGGLINSQSEVGGWDDLNAGQVVTDTDRDGMPDSWEASAGTLVNQADNNGDIDDNGYSNLEEYLHWAGRYPR